MLGHSPKHVTLRLTNDDGDDDDDDDNENDLEMKSIDLSFLC